MYLHPGHLPTCIPCLIFCHDTQTMHAHSRFGLWLLVAPPSSFWFPSRRMSPLTTAPTLCSLWVHDAATTVSPLATQEDFHKGHMQCTVRGKNDLKDKIACRLVHGDCNMCGVDVYHLLPSFSLLYCFLFLSSSFLPFLSPLTSPPSSFLCLRN